MARRSKQVADEVAAALARGSPHPEATASDWKKRITEIQNRARRASDPQERAVLQQELDAASDGLRSAQRKVAMRPTFVTDTNLFALKKVVLEHGGPTFPSRLPAVDAPHIKRCVEAGLVEVKGTRAHLTPAGRERVGDALIEDIARESSWTPKENPFVPSAEKRAELLAKDVAAHDAKIKQLEDVLAKVTQS